ncbi:MAG TPA: iron-siderophore ABC transporter substrate-binding protein, partial [Actinokineospora sp.]|nr:iron-siderophore ABC transporter substrate-binding protein [Actinokineospora sp.]
MSPTSKRTRFAVLLPAVALAVAVAGCGKSDPAPAGAPAPTQTGSAAAFPVTVEHKYGSTEIKAERDD